MLESFTCATFTARLGEAFRLHVQGREPIEAVLVEAIELPRGPGRPRAPFSIVFRTVSAPVFPQQIYRLEHSEIGVFELFLVPIGPDGHGMRYEAIFT